MIATLEGMDRAIREEIARVDRVSAEMIREGAEGLKEDLRQMTRRALGHKVANAWRGKNYPEDRASLVYTRAPEIIDLNMRGGTIVPVTGSRYLAIPTDKVPRKRGGRGSKARMNPFEVEAHFNQDLIFKPSRNRRAWLAFVDTGARRKRGSGNRGKRQARAAAKQTLVHMFTFVRSVTARKTIDPDASFQRWKALTKRMLEKELG